MEIEKLLNKERLEISVDEAEVQKVIQKSKAAFMAYESSQVLSRKEFIWNQVRMIPKKWWIIQFVVLCLAWQFLMTENEAFYIRREMGVVASLFTILVIPELWRNLSNHCMEIEIASYYSLHQIYAARILLFGAMDVLLLTTFICGAHFMLKIGLTDLVTQFLLPVVVTACICFLTLGRQYCGRWIPIGLCTLWSTVWWVIASNDRLYSAVTFPVWLVITAFAVILLVLSVCRLLKNCDQYVEVNLNGAIAE